MKMNKAFFKDMWNILKGTASEFVHDKVLKMSAALAYYTVFSIAPMLIVLIGLGSIFYGKEAMQGKVVSQIDHIVGSEAALQIQEVLTKTSLQHDNVIATAVGFIVLLIGATGIFGEVQDSINQIWGLKANPKKGGVMKILLNRLVSFSMILVMGFILLVSLMLNAMLGTFFERLQENFSGALVDNLYLIDQLVMIAVVALLFASIFKMLPDAKIKWKDVWVGSFVTSLLFLGGKYLIGYYLEKNASISAYGAAGSLIVILLWVYYSSIILYFGAEFTQVYLRYHGKSIQPNRYAIWVENKVVEKKFNTDIASPVTDKKQHNP